MVKNNNPKPDGQLPVFHENLIVAMGNITLPEMVNWKPHQRTFIFNPNRMWRSEAKPVKYMFFEVLYWHLN